jgi:hypothetical protein
MQVGLVNPTPAEAAYMSTSMFESVDVTAEYGKPICQNIHETKQFVLFCHGRFSKAEHLPPRDNKEPARHQRAERRNDYEGLSSGNLLVPEISSFRRLLLKEPGESIFFSDIAHRLPNP